ncbi:MAG: hypothetical protein WBK48_05370 [Dethiobacteria bacterium]|nr:hypothetical protein [Bacillota bacterium]HOP69539.1 hypothetical protein [Bacillota bacterium]HPT34472.1 hypothetical protein [Bacillota bacterium]HPZ64587.1 hypothetical protein [Bacillota bacterium]HQD06926.1 hypothetical protein [Bacillota bacterium]
MDNAWETVLARLHLRAILPVIEDIAPVDQVIKELTAGWNVRIQFQMAGGDPATTLIFQNGTLKTSREKVPGPKVVLTFKDARFVNEVFQNKTKKSPTPNIVALGHLSKLLKLDQVLGRLEHYLRPEEAFLKDPDNLKFCVELTLKVLAYGIKEVAEHDPEMRPVVEHLPNGTIEIRVKEGPAVHASIKDGIFSPGIGPAEKPNAVLEIQDLETAWKMLQGDLDLFAAVGSSRIKIRGLVPLLDGINPLLDRLSLYLA